MKIQWLIADKEKIDDRIREFPSDLKRPRYMSLLHGVYEDNQQMVCNSMQSLSNDLQPDFVLTSSHVNLRARSRTESVVGSVVKAQNTDSTH